MDAPGADDAAQPPPDPARVEIEPWLTLYSGPRPSAAEAHRDALAARPQHRLAPTSFVAAGAIVVADELELGDFAAIAAGAVVRGSVAIGAHSTLNPGAQVIGQVRIGEGVRIAANTVIVGESHVHDDPDTPIWLQGVTSRGIVIEDGVWIGANATIVDGVRVGAHSIVGAGAVVTHDVEAFAIVGGVPARPIDDRRRRAAARRSRDVLGTIDRFAREQVPDLVGRLAPALLATAPDDATTDPRVLNDAVELAAMVGALDLLGARDELAARIQVMQDATTGLFVDPRDGPAAVPLDPLGREWEMYGIESSGCALEVLGAAPTHPVRVVAELAADDLLARLDALDLEWLAWPSGAWIDALATGARLNRAHHGIGDTMTALWGWLLTRQDPASGLWGHRLGSLDGEPVGWLMAVNGFYRAARGTYAAFGVDVPRPERVIDTVLDHGAAFDWFATERRDACNVLDVIHPLWLCGRQTTHRRAEIRDAAATVLTRLVDDWHDGAGFAFAAGEAPSPKGTEMWLAVAATGAAILGEDEHLGFTPRGIHRLDVAPH